MRSRERESSFSFDKVYRFRIKQFQRRLSHLKRSTLKFLRNSGRETGFHPRIKSGGMLSLELL